MLYHQAACFVYGLPHTAENAQWAMKKLEEEEMVPIHLINDDTYAYAVGKDRQERDPIHLILFKKQDPSIVEDPSKDTQGSLSMESESQGAGTRRGSATTTASLESVEGEGAVDYFAKIAMNSAKGAADSPTHKTEFVTSEYQKALLAERFKNLPSASDIETWINASGRWGARVTHRSKEYGGKALRGRWLHILRPIHRAALIVKSTTAVRAYVTNNPMHTVGFCRKSKKDTDKGKIKSLQAQVWSLKNLGADCVFGGVMDASASPITAKNTVPANMKGKLKGLDGDAQEFAMELRSVKPMRLMVLDYPGLCTSAGHVIELFKHAEQLQEVIIKIRGGFHIHTRHDILNGTASLRFGGRKSFSKRSRIH
ncbi:hypothetical protein BC940DRAFT_320683 [Gongronella butleri]|nr:hypothetical protein BC940DRAFT_320683 [Gongronella butleri]